MKKITKTLLAVLSAASLVGVASCNKPTEPQKTPTEIVEEVTPVAKFTGSQTIQSVVYNVELALYEDNTLKLIPGNGAAEKTGTYTFVEGVGYEFVISGVEYETKWNESAKAHEVSYELKLGDAGSGVVKLSLVDEDFVCTVKGGKENLIENAKFDGVLNFYGAHIIHLVFNADGTYNITTETTMEMVKGLLEKTGAYTFANNEITVTIDGTEYKSVYNAETGAYDLTYTIKGSDGNPEVTLSYKPVNVVFTGYEDAFGGTNFELKFTSATECLVDVTLAFTSMNAAFDRTGTYVVENGQIKVTIGEETFTSTFDEATGTYSITYKLVGSEATLYPVLTFQVWGN